MTTNSNSPHNHPSQPERDRFELLSAYIDGEVNVAERQLVQQWLDDDPKIQRLYRGLLKMRQGCSSIPVPSSVPSPQYLSEQVFQRLDRRKRSRVMFWSGAAIAALFVVAISGLLPKSDSLTPQLTTSSVQDNLADQSLMSYEDEADSLMITLNHPVVEIPPTDVSN